MSVIAGHCFCGGCRVPETVAHLSAFDRATVQIQHAAADSKATVHDQRGPARLEFFDGQYLCPTWERANGDEPVT